MSDTQGVSKEEAARLLGCSVRTVERRIRAGELDTSILHTKRGPRVRVHLPAPEPVVEATYSVVTTPPDATTTPDGGAAVGVFATPTITPTPEDRHLARLALEVAADLQRENARLRAMIESHERERAARPGPLQRAWRALRGRGDERR